MDTQTHTHTQLWISTDSYQAQWAAIRDREQRAADATLPTLYSIWFDQCQLSPSLQLALPRAPIKHTNLHTTMELTVVFPVQLKRVWAWACMAERSLTDLTDWSWGGLLQNALCLTMLHRSHTCYWNHMSYSSMSGAAQLLTCKHPLFLLAFSAQICYDNILWLIHVELQLYIGRLETWEWIRGQRQRGHHPGSEEALHSQWVIGKDWLWLCVHVKISLWLFLHVCIPCIVVWVYVNACLAVHGV